MTNTLNQIIEAKEKNRETMAQILKNVEKPLFWLAVMVAQGDLTEAEAGYLITEYGIKE